MPIYTVKDNETGKTLDLKGDSPPTEAELQEIFASFKQDNSTFDNIKKAADFVGGTIGGPIGGFLAGKAVDKAKEVVDDPRGAALGVVDTLPAVGAVSGALVGSGLASVPLGALGAAGGQAFKQLGRRALGEDPTPGVSIPFSDKKVPDIPGIPKEASDIVSGGCNGSVQFRV
jgi:hypothetical protein